MTVDHLFSTLKKNFFLLNLKLANNFSFSEVSIEVAMCETLGLAC